MHLSPDELIDLAEGARAESAVRHVQSCEVCRHQLAELRATMAAAAEVDVPEPSPLFWEHLSERVREAVAAEEVLHARSWLWGWGWPKAWPLSAGVAVAAATVALAVYLTVPPRAPTPLLSPAIDVAAVPSAIEVSPLQPFGEADDPSLALVADLTSQMDPEAVTETGLTTHVGGVDEVVANLTDGERLELQRLLKEALAKPGA